jgi:small neutral amino acid transporter SnatA (MarC family)
LPKTRISDGLKGADLMGVAGIRVATRLMGLLLAVIAVQFMVNGYPQIR